VCADVRLGGSQLEQEGIKGGDGTNKLRVFAVVLSIHFTPTNHWPNRSTNHPTQTAHQQIIQSLFMQLQAPTGCLHKLLNTGIQRSASTTHARTRQITHRGAGGAPHNLRAGCTALAQQSAPLGQQLLDGAGERGDGCGLLLLGAFDGGLVVGDALSGGGVGGLELGDTRILLLKQPGVFVMDGSRSVVVG